MDARGPVRVGGRLLGAVLVITATAVLVSAAVVPVLVAGHEAVVLVEDEWVDHPPLPDHLPGHPQLSTVHDVDGTRIAELAGPIKREPVPLEAIPQVVIDAVIATEDADFYEHTGVHHPSIARAAVRNLAAGGIEEGASTITQQYVRIALLDPEQTIERKLNEIVWAVELEERLSKDEILERYLNVVYLGQGVYGFGTAAKQYFSRHVRELELAEAALLAGTIRAPATTNAVDDPDAALRRRDIVIGQMLAQGFISEDEAEEARAQELELDLRGPLLGEPFWVDIVKRLIYDPDADLQPGLQEAVGASVGERIEALFEGGLRISTTLDRQTNRHAEAVVASYLDDPAEDPMGALLSIEHATGALRAIALGPRDYGECPDDHEGPCPATQVNPAVPFGGGSGRQSGSAFKPFITAAALEAGMRGDDLEYDAPSGEVIEGCGAPGEDYEPHNFDQRDHEEVGLAEAMQRSLNTYFVQLARDVGVERVAASARDHGVRYSPNLAGFSDRMCSIALGAAEVFPLDMVAGYGTWANGGVHCAPYVIERIEDADGELVYEHEPRCERVTSRPVAERMQRLLQRPVGAGGTAPLVGQQVPGAVGKTGTTNDFVDAWFVGSAGPHTTAAWVGFERPRPMRGLTVDGRYLERVTGGALPAPMWADFMVGPD